MIKKRGYFSENETNSFDIHRALGDSIRLTPRIHQLSICRYLSYLPREVVDFIVENYAFIGQDENELGSQYVFDDYPWFAAKRGLILLAGQLWKRKPIEKAMVVAHEVAHAVIHDKFVRDKRNIAEKRLEMEEEANRLAIKWLSKRYSKKRLRQVCKYSY